MKHIIPYLLILLVVTSCNYKELGCVICYTTNKKIVTTFHNGQIKTIKKEKYIMKAIDTPCKRITHYKEFDSTGVLILKRKGYQIRNVWDFDYNKYQLKEIVYHPISDSIKKEITILKDGKMIFNKEVKR